MSECWEHLTAALWNCSSTIRKENSSSVSECLPLASLLFPKARWCCSWLFHTWQMGVGDGFNGRRDSSWNLSTQTALHFTAMTCQWRGGKRAACGIWLQILQILNVDVFSWLISSYKLKKNWHFFFLWCLFLFELIVGNSWCSDLIWW